MISKEYEKYSLECDGCGNYIPQFESFQDALDFMDEHGWTKEIKFGEWVNYCTDCMEE